MQPKYVRDALLVALSKLDPTHPGFTASQKIRDALNNVYLRAYLDSWVIPVIECATGDTEFSWNRSHIERDANHVRRQLRAHYRERYNELEERRKLMTVQERADWRHSLEGKEYKRIATYFPTTAINAQATQAHLEPKIAAVTVEPLLAVGDVQS